MYGPESVGSLRSDEIPLGANVRSAENYTVEPFDRSWPTVPIQVARTLTGRSRALWDLDLAPKESVRMATADIG